MDWSFDWLIDCSIDWLIDCSIDWLIDWDLIDWLIDWLMVFLANFMNFDDLRRQVQDLKDELRVKNQQQEGEREKRVHSLQSELQRVQQSEQRASRDCDILHRQIEQHDMEMAQLRQQVEDAKFNFADEQVVDQLNGRVLYLQQELEGCQRIIEKLESELLAATSDLESTRMSLDEKEQQLEQGWHFGTFSAPPPPPIWIFLIFKKWQSLDWLIDWVH